MGQIGEWITNLLSDTGLFKDARTGELAEGVAPYHPRFELWSDGAAKRRWIWLPVGHQIDASDRDAWQFPVGTKLWKEFTREGVRVETRLLEKIGDAPADWRAVAYVWNEDGADARAVPEGVVDARGTQHDVPAARDCMGCHGGTRSHVLGFTAVQLPRSADADELSLDALVKQGRLDRAALPAHEIPGDEQTQRVLGYLHANCAHCHNQDRPPEPDGGRSYNPRRDFDLSLRVDDLASVESTGVFRTAIGRVITPGAPESSAILKRARGDLHLFQARMPPLAAELLDPSLLPMLEEWIRELRKEKAR